MLYLRPVGAAAHGRVELRPVHAVVEVEACVHSRAPPALLPAPVILPPGLLPEPFCLGSRSGHDRAILLSVDIVKKLKRLEMMHTM